MNYAFSNLKIKGPFEQYLMSCYAPNSALSSNYDPIRLFKSVGQQVHIITIINNHVNYACIVYSIPNSVLSIAYDCIIV